MSELKTKTDVQSVGSTPKPEGRKLFNYYIQKNIADMGKERAFFYRTNRWRFSSKGYTTANKYNRIKYPLLAAAGATILLDWYMGYDLPVHH
mmetsp:Transcript_1559/g.1663  ORF Transcript_1559/g.1663 Transcript_1559/m.1663 type:complete len:92 (+) Transcript_1559:38-313(+)